MDLAGGFGLPGSHPGRAGSSRATLRRLLQLPAETRLLVLPPPRSRSATPCCSTAPPRPSGSTWPRPIPQWTRAAPGPGARRIRAPARPIRRLPLGCRRRPPPRPSCARRRHRRRDGPGSARLAPRPGDARARRGRRRGPRAFRGPGTGSRRGRRRGRVPRTGGRAHPGRRATCREGACGGPEQAPRGSTGGGAAAPFHRARGAARRARRCPRATPAGPDRVRHHPRPEAPPLLLDAARRLESLDAALARETYLDAFGAALFAGRLARAAMFGEVAAAVLAADWDGTPPRSRAARQRSPARRPRLPRRARLRRRNRPG